MGAFQNSRSIGQQTSILFHCSIAIQAYLKTGRKTEADISLAELKKINPNAPTISEIEKQLSQPEKTIQPQ